VPLQEQNPRTLRKKKRAGETPFGCAQDEPALRKPVLSPRRVPHLRRWRVYIAAYPAFTRWANLWRAYGAAKNERGHGSRHSARACRARIRAPRQTKKGNSRSLTSIRKKRGWVRDDNVKNRGRFQVRSKTPFALRTSRVEGPRHGGHAGATFKPKAEPISTA